jgi:hypothetical protein
MTPDSQQPTCPYWTIARVSYKNGDKNEWGCTRPHTPAQDFSNPKIGDWIPGVGDITTEYERQFIARYGEAARTATLAENKRGLDAIEKFKTEAWARHDPCDGGFTKFYQSLRVTEESLRRTAQEHP